MIPAVLGIEEALVKCETQLECLKNALRQGLSNWFQELIMKPHYVIATALDCHYKPVPFKDDRV